MKDAAPEMLGEWEPQSDRGLTEGADLGPPGGWALVFIAIMLTGTALAWGLFLIGSGQL